MRRFLPFLLIGLLLAACNDDSPAPVPSPPPRQVQPFEQWNITYSTGTPPTMERQPNGDFTVVVPLPPGSLHYVTTPAPALPLGGKIVLTFEITGTGTVVPKPENDQPPATLHLYVQRVGDDMQGRIGSTEFFRWWSKAGLVITNAGGYQLTATLDPSQWTSVLGKAGDDPAAGNYFQQALSNAAVIGFTLGGRSFWGHGDQSAGSPMTLVLHSVTVN